MSLFYILFLILVLKTGFVFLHSTVSRKNTLLSLQRTELVDVALKQCIDDPHKLSPIVPDTSS